MNPHHEKHRSGRSGWLRAAVLGSNDAIVSTASLMVGVAEAAGSRSAVLVAGIAGMVAGSMSMAVGEYVSVSTQRDAEQADIARERRELSRAPEAELEELTAIYQARGLERALAAQVAQQLSAHDRLGAHVRDELGIDPRALARPLQAAWISAASFAFFSLLPIAALLVAPRELRVPCIIVASMVALAALGALGAHLGGARRAPAALRVGAGGAFAMLVTAAIGRLLGVAFG